MKKTNIIIPFDGEKLDAMRHFTQADKPSLEEEILNFVQKTYEKKVPANVRDFLAAKDASDGV